MQTELDVREGISSDSLKVTLRLATLTVNKAKIFKLHLSLVINYTYPCSLPPALSIKHSALLMEQKTAFLM